MSKECPTCKELREEIERLNGQRPIIRGSRKIYRLPDNIMLVYSFERHRWLIMHEGVEVGSALKLTVAREQATKYRYDNKLEGSQQKRLNWRTEASKVYQYGGKTIQCIKGVWHIDGEPRPDLTSYQKARFYVKQLLLDQEKAEK